MKAIEPLNLDHFDEEFFRHAIHRHVAEYVAHFSDRLVAVYVSGSVHRNEAVPGVSDLDLLSFIRDPLVEADGEWRHQTLQNLDRELGSLHGLTLPRTLTEAFLQGLTAVPAGHFTIARDPIDGTLRRREAADARVRTNWRHCCGHGFRALSHVTGAWIH